MTADNPLRELSEDDFDVCFAGQPVPPTLEEDLRQARGRHRRRVRTSVISVLAAVVLVVGVGWGLTATSLEAVPAGPATTLLGRDPSGLRLITDEYYATRTIPTVPPEVEPALTFARVLSDGNRSDFGFPRIEGDRVVLPATSARSAPIARATSTDGRVRALVAYDDAVRASYPRKTNPPDLLAKRLKLTPDNLHQFSAYVDVVPGSQSIQAAYDLQDRVNDVASAQRPGGTVLSCGYDQYLGLVVLDLSKPAPAIASALVAEFGTETVALHIDSSAGGSSTEVRIAPLDGYLTPTTNDSITVRAITGEGDVVTDASAEETDEQVRVTLTITSPTGPRGGVGILTEQVIPLRQPLGSRVVIDDATGKTLPVLKK